MINVAVCGANGKMGKEVCNAVENENGAELVAKIDIAGDGVYKTIDGASKEQKIDVLIDFTAPFA